MKKLFIGFSVLILIFLLSACGSTSPSSSEPATETTNQTATKEETVNQEESTPKTRTISTPKGDIEIPVEPKRVVGLSIVYPEFLYALGITPVAVQNYHDEFPAYLKEPFKDTLKMGIDRTPNFEAILSAKPDLIIAPAWWSEKDYDQLSKIAPTVLLPERELWTDELKDIAQVLNLEDKAEEVIKEYNDKAAEIKNKLDQKLGNETVMYMMIMPKELIVYGKTQSRGIVIHQELGLEPVAAFPESEVSVSLSMETLPEYNPDHIILQLDDANNEEIQQTYKELQESPLWKNLTAVKNGNVYMVGGIEWFNVGMSPLANHYAIEELLQKIEK